MIGDAEILQAELLRRRGHFLEGIAAIARAGVTMKCAAQIFRLDQARQASFGGGFDFAAIFAQLRRNEIEIERTIKLRFIPHFRNRVRRSILARDSFGGREPIFVQGPAALQRAISQDDIVLFASGKIAERKRIFRRANHAQVGLDAGAQPDAGFGRALRDERSRRADARQKTQ